MQSATGLEDVDRWVSDAAQAVGIPVNVVDRPELCSFIAPAVVDRDPVVIGISTGGAAPVLARRVREAIERLLPARLGHLARFAESFRTAVAATLPAGRARLRFWERFFDGPFAGQVLRGQDSAAREAMVKLINRPMPVAEDGQVAIVGAGPGDPDLLTLGALRLLQRADAVVYDKLVGPEIVDLARRDAERIYVGKSRSNHTLSQDRINELLVRLAGEGKRVVRLKGGDPFIFGRGGEELVDFLRQSRHRGGAGARHHRGGTAAAALCRPFRSPIRGLVPGGDPGDRPRRRRASRTCRLGRHWPGVNHTLALYMGLSNAGRVAERLIAHGLRGRHAGCRGLERASLPDQQKIETGRLDRISRPWWASNAIEGSGVDLDRTRWLRLASVDTLVEALPELARCGRPMTKRRLRGMSAQES